MSFLTTKDNAILSLTTLLFISMAHALLVQEAPAQRMNIPDDMEALGIDVLGPIANLLAETLGGA
jgi:hypothetical protein